MDFNAHSKKEYFLFRYQNSPPILISLLLCNLNHANSMPIIQSTAPASPFLQFNGHLQTLIPGMYRKVLSVQYERERITLSDGDFLDLDWIRQQNRKLVVLTHGLEGNSKRQYMLGMAKVFRDAYWDVLAWHCRSCSEDLNIGKKLYHHGDTADMHEVAQYAASKNYDQIVLIGFSMGANIIIKYLSVCADKVPANVSHAVAFSGPCDLEAASLALDAPFNGIYKTKFLMSLGNKIRAKAVQYPDWVDVSLLEKVRVFRDFDEWFSAPLCGYKSADEFYFQSSSKNFVHDLRTPTLLINAYNDPILTPSCMPLDEARNHPFFYFEMTPNGGHCGFMERGNHQSAWSERRALAWVSA
jgi:uncharacterized protein